MKIEKVEISKIKPNDKNPRTIKDAKYKELLQSIKEFPEMLDIRPIVVDDDMMVLGGNMRLRACTEAKMKEVAIIKASELTEEQRKRFVIIDNLPYGEWDWDVLSSDWDVAELADWGMDIPTIQNTELLSGLEYDPLYYEPKEMPKIKLEDCIDLEKYNAKLKALDEYNLTKAQKDILKIFAYRFIKIDFEWVANYYFFNAGDEEKKAIERLRLVLTDNGINGFIEDDLLKILGMTNKDFNPNQK